jgi:hypothetical protein
MVADIPTVYSVLNILMFSHLFDSVNPNYLQFSKDLKAAYIYAYIYVAVPCTDLLLWTKHRTPHHTITHSFVKPTATNAAK